MDDRVLKLMQEALKIENKIKEIEREYDRLAEYKASLSGYMEAIKYELNSNCSNNERSN